MKYFIRIDNETVFVTEEIYKAYCQGQRKERYFRESDIHNKTVYYNALDTAETNGCDLFSDPAVPSIEQTIENRIDCFHLKNALKGLKKEELDIVSRIYYYDQSLRQAAKETGVALSTLHHRHRKVLEKLRGMMEQGNT